MRETNKLVEYGLKAAEVGRILLEPELKTYTPQRVLTEAAPKYPDCFPYSVKGTILPEQDSYFFALYGLHQRFWHQGHKCWTG